MLRYIDPKVNSVSRMKYEESDGQLGWIKAKSAKQIIKALKAEQPARDKVVQQYGTLRTPLAPTRAVRPDLSLWSRLVIVTVMSLPRGHERIGRNGFMHGKGHRMRTGVRA